MGDPNEKLNTNKEKLRQAAMMLLALGPPNAARILRHLEQSEVERLMQEILQLGPIQEEEKKQALQKLHQEIQNLENSITGGKDKAHALLVAALGEKKASEVLERIERWDIGRKFHELEEYSADLLAEALKQESDQTIAVVLSQLHPPYAAQVLSRLEAKRKPEIARRIAHLKQIHPQALQAIAESLQNKLEKLKIEQPAKEPEGETILAQILKNMPLDKEEALLQALEQQEPEITDRIKAQLFVFEDLLELDREGIRRLMEAVPDVSIWGRALKGARADLRRHIFSCISLNRASDITQEMERLGPIALREVEYARRVILRAVEQLRASGEIWLARDRQDLL